MRTGSGSTVVIAMHVYVRAESGRRATPGQWLRAARVGSQETRRGWHEPCMSHDSAGTIVHDAGRAKGDVISVQR